jgi:hypothetical protein
MELIDLFLQQVPIRYLDDYLLQYIDYDRQLDLFKQIDTATLMGDSSGSYDYRKMVLKRFILHVEQKSDGVVHEKIIENYVDGVILTKCCSARYDNNVVVYRLHDKTVRADIFEEPSIIMRSGSTGRRTWEAAKALMDYLAQELNRDWDFYKKYNYIELGSGTGFLGVILYKLLNGSHGGDTDILLTDGSDDVVKGIWETLRLNELNRLENLYVKRLRWTEDSPLISESKPQILLAADVTFDRDSIADLVKCIYDFLKGANCSFALVAATIRSEQTFNKFLSLSIEEGLKLTEVKRIQNNSKQPPLQYFFIPPETPDIIIYKLELDETVIQV